MALLNADRMQMNEDGYAYNENCYHFYCFCCLGERKRKVKGNLDEHGFQLSAREQKNTSQFPESTFNKTILNPTILKPLLRE